MIETQDSEGLLSPRSTQTQTLQLMDKLVLSHPSDNLPQTGIAESQA